MTRVLFIGDVHLRHNNAKETQVLMEKIKPLTYDVAVLAGDVLDTHEKVDVQLLNRAYTLVHMLKNKTLVFVLVGNHDYINNQQFLSDAHWMNGMKEWTNVNVVDYPISWVSNDNQLFIFTPYVFPGRFIEALSTIATSTKWSDATCIFAHQEIKGCKMGAFTSVNGDEWDLDWPLIISGHIHESQRHQENVIYPGSALTHSFGGANRDQGLSIFTFEKKLLVDEEKFILDLPMKRTFYLKIGDSIKSRDLIPENRFAMSGSIANIESFKKSKQYKLMKDANVKIIFKISNDTLKFADSNIDSNNTVSNLFTNILDKLIKKEKNELLTDDYIYCCY